MNLPPPIRRLAIVGPESSGKSTLAEQLAHQLGTVWVPEPARLYYDRKGVCYEASDIPEIAALGQTLVQAALPQARAWLIQDTDLLTITLWSDWLYQGCPAAIRQEAEAEPIDLVLLLAPDLPWSYDPQRCHPDPATRWR